MEELSAPDFHHEKVAVSVTPLSPTSGLCQFLQFLKKQYLEEEKKCCFHLNHSNQVQNTGYMSTKLSYFCHIQKLKCFQRSQRNTSHEHFYLAWVWKWQRDGEKNTLFCTTTNSSVYLKVSKDKSLSEHNFHFKKNTVRIQTRVNKRISAPITSLHSQTLHLESHLKLIRKVFFK